MSRYEWEAGTIVLPTAALAKVKAATRAAALAHRQRLYDSARAFWTELPRRHRNDPDR